MDMYKKMAVGVAGAAGLSLVAWRTLFPWIGYDIAIIRRHLKYPDGLKDIENGIYNIDVFESHVKNQPEKTFIIFEDQYLSYSYVDKMANRVSNMALQWSLEPGDVVAIMINNGPEFVWTYLGFVKIGIPVSLINHNLRDASLARSIKATNTKVLIVGEGTGLLEEVLSIQHELPGIQIYAQGTAADASQNYLPFDEIMSASPSSPISKNVRAGVHPFSVDCYISTSGTTGDPKAAPITHLKARLNSLFLGMAEYSSDDILYITLPLYHSSAHQIGLNGTIQKGATMIIRRKFSAKAFWDDCRKYQATGFQYIGELCRYLLTQPERPTDGQHNIRFGFGNGLRLDIWETFVNRFKIPEIVEFFAATEGVGGFVNISMKPGACGRLSPFLQRFDVAPRSLVKYDPLTFQPLRDKNGRCIKIKPGENGLVLASYRPGVPISLYIKKADNDKKLVRNAFTQGDVCFNFGDILYLDKEYFLYFVDRTGDTFRWKGENVSTTEVSNALSGLEFVEDASVYGVLVPGNDGKAGMASIKLRDNQEFTESRRNKLYEHCTKKLPSYAVPLVIRLREHINITVTFKHNKVQLAKDGFDPSKVTDPLYYIDHEQRTYLPMDDIQYMKIISAKSRL